MTYSYVISVNY